MKILLLGEFSGLHKNLQVGLRAAGHHVDLVSSGDGFKAIYGDVMPPMLKQHWLWDKVKYRFDYYSFLRIFSGYDVVQLININVLIGRLFPYKAALRQLKKNNGMVFLLATGDDAVYWNKSRNWLKYGPFEDELKYGNQKINAVFQTRTYIDFNQYVAENVDGIIPTAYDYSIGYKEFNNRKKTIPLPIDTSLIKFTPNEKKDKLKVFHGLNRYGFKGTRHIELAFSELNVKNGDSLSCEIIGGLPLSDYLELINESNIVVDQVNTYSYGMNAIYAAAKGKIVLSGAEPECLRELNVQESPIINVKPDSKDIQDLIMSVLNNKINLLEWSEKSRSYIEEVHCCNKVADLYVKCWRQPTPTLSVASS